MTNDNILMLFEGLTVAEARKFRQAIFPALQKIRSEIIGNRQQTQAQSTSKQIISRGNNDAMQSENPEWAAMPSASPKE
jgi:hypothetical protein